MANLYSVSACLFFAWVCAAKAGVRTTPCLLKAVISSSKRRFSSKKCCMASAASASATLNSSPLRACFFPDSDTVASVSEILMRATSAALMPSEWLRARVKVGILGRSRVERREFPAGAEEGSCMDCARCLPTGAERGNSS